MPVDLVLFGEDCADFDFMQMAVIGDTGGPPFSIGTLLVVECHSGVLATHFAVGVRGTLDTSTEFHHITTQRQEHLLQK